MQYEFNVGMKLIKPTGVVLTDRTQDYIVYHAMADPGAGWDGRTTRAERFTWNPDGSPSFPRPSGFGVDLPLPSGQ